MNIFLLILAVVPGLLIILFVYFMDKYEKEDLLPIVICFVLGVFSTFPILQLERLGITRGIDNPMEIIPMLIYSFLFVALVEEGSKFIILWIYPYRQSFFNEPFDGILYAVVIAMGFATLENVLYASRFNVNALVLRAFTAVPAHASFAVMQGYFVGKAKFKSKNKWKLMGLGLLASVCLHGLYDFFILQQAYKNLAVLAFFTLSIGLYLSIQLIHAHQKDSPFREEEPE